MALDSGPQQQQEQPPFLPEALPDVAVAAVCRHLTNSRCPGPCRLAPVCKGWRHAGQQHLAGAAVQLCLLQKPGDPTQPAAHGASQLPPKHQLVMELTSSLSAWLAKYGHLLVGFSLQFADWPSNVDGERQQEGLPRRQVALDQMAAALAAAAAAVSTATGSTAAAVAAEQSVGTGVGPVGCGGVTPGPAGLQLRTLRLPLGEGNLPGCIPRLLATSPHLRALRLDLLQDTTLTHKTVVGLLLKALRHAPHLTDLQMPGEWVGLSEWSNTMLLRSLPRSLEVLVLLGADGSSWEVGALARLTRLRQLRLTGGRIFEPQGDAAAAALAGLTRLTALECETALGSSQALLQLPSLVAVGTLAGQPLMPVSPEVGALQQLQGRPSLRRLTLTEPFSPEVLQELGQLTQLEELVVESACFGQWLQRRLPSSSWREAIGALTRLQCLQAPLAFLCSERGNNSPLLHLQQLRVVHAVVSNMPRDLKLLTRAGEDHAIWSLAQALVQAKQLQEVQISGVDPLDLLSVHSVATDLLPKVAVTVTTQVPGCCSVVEEVLG